MPTGRTSRVLIVKIILIMEETVVSPVHKKWSNKSEKRSWLPATGIESSCHPGTSSMTYINLRLL